ncbi:hypothetical protein [Neptuniibacter sp. QD37_11]|uniref:hypothetical protein n=1 Tax=Neptuniibacter sp. QD37_11 TaxID=3398209 RepID=UPI0039F497A8
MRKNKVLNSLAAVMFAVSAGVVCAHDIPGKPAYSVLVGEDLNYESQDRLDKLSVREITELVKAARYAQAKDVDFGLIDFYLENRIQRALHMEFNVNRDVMHEGVKIEQRHHLIDPDGLKHGEITHKVTFEHGEEFLTPQMGNDLINEQLMRDGIAPVDKYQAEIRVCSFTGDLGTYYEMAEIELEKISLLNVKYTCLDDLSSYWKNRINDYVSKITFRRLDPKASSQYDLTKPTN